ncbi:uncharacterized protein LOC111715983 isoform X2 [Eurytemora carolleeae]|uniref:uncharacterized protein LOC111715983 isoform X2 n=1 Tax=Eurytemora carolleeae TaxID=1294199 RepID=UPI000C77169C|nr:uncharacterized protein LOC111715983 isoform X2 [Eurytemora carolleeae]|eukprot:XP_023347160.1 uncharacterized protein LOC111715983 isoform X2 [Eurytemora affinis]
MPHLEEQGSVAVYADGGRSLVIGIWTFVALVVFISYIVHWIQVIKYMRRRKNEMREDGREGLEKEKGSFQSFSRIDPDLPYFNIKQLERQTTSFFDIGTEDDYREVVRKTWERRLSSGTI